MCVSSPLSSLSLSPSLSLFPCLDGGLDALRWLALRWLFVIVVVGGGSCQKMSVLCLEKKLANIEMKGKSKKKHTTCPRDII